MARALGLVHNHTVTRSRIGMGLLCAPSRIAEFGIFPMVSARPEMYAPDSSFGWPLPAHSRRLVSLQAVDLFVMCTWDVAAQRRRLPEPGEPPPVARACGTFAHRAI
jgi:hypothetical protein